MKIRDKGRYIMGRKWPHYEHVERAVANDIMHKVDNATAGEINVVLRPLVQSYFHINETLK